MNIQHFIVVGRATKDSEVFESKKKTKYAKFSIAVNEYSKKDKEENASFYDVVVFANSAKTPLDNIKKGDKILVQGKPEAEAYLSKDNEPKAKITVVADTWKVLK